MIFSISRSSLALKPRLRASVSIILEQPYRLVYFNDLQKDLQEWQSDWNNCLRIMSIINMESANKVKQQLFADFGDLRQDIEKAGKIQSIGVCSIIVDPVGHKSINKSIAAFQILINNPFLQKWIQRRLNRWRKNDAMFQLKDFREGFCIWIIA